MTSREPEMPVLREKDEEGNDSRARETEMQNSTESNAQVTRVACIPAFRTESSRNTTIQN